jgi:hypothetical protein
VTLREIDRFSGQPGPTRSALLVMAAKLMLQAHSYGAILGCQAGVPRDRPWSATSAAAKAASRQTSWADRFWENAEAPQADHGQPM